MMQVRVSTLESFRLVMTTDWKPEHELVDYIRAGQTSEPNWRMRAGTAWHARLEGKSPDDGWIFRPEHVEAGIAHAGPGLREMTARESLVAGGVNLTVKGTCDHIRGLVIQDHKTKFGQCDPKDYEGSLQWRCYLWLFGASVFRYNLFQFAESDDESGGLLDLLNIHTVKFWRYPAMVWDITRWADDFVDWARARCLLPYLDTPERAAA